MLKELKKRFGSHIYATNEATTLEESIVALLKEKNLTLTTAESCTGGMLSARLTNVPGVQKCSSRDLLPIPTVQSGNCSM